MAKKTIELKHNYDESKIQTLSSLEHIRLRTGMYIGRTGDGSNYEDGIYVLLKEVIDNSVDEYIMGFGDKIVVELEDNKINIRDFGRGIPFGKLIECVSVINTGAKYNDDVFQFSVGLNGVGTKAVNALSSKFVVASFRGGKVKIAEFKQGKLIGQVEKSTDKPDGTLIQFIPDKEIFGVYNFETEFLEKRIWHYAYLNSGLKLYLNKKVFTSPNGLKDLLKSEVNSDRLYDLVYHKEDKLEYAFCHTEDGYGETYFSFVNGQHTVDGGSHQSAFREGILKGINEYADKLYSGVDVREGIVGAIAIKLKDPIFESQTKNKLGNTEIKSDIVNKVKDSLVKFLHRNEEIAKKIIDKVDNNEKLRKDLQVVTKEAKERLKKISLKIPGLRDCKHNFQDSSKYAKDTMIFLTEGQSASGSMIACRDVLTQAIFSLRGKPLNVYGHKKDTIYKNEELYNVMKALDIEDGIETLRYNKIVIATDSDVDGLHIRNLLLTYFLIYFEPVVLSGHLNILETPLYRVRNKKETIYCYNDEEKEAAVNKLGKQIEITRFKGLGEISPNEFKQFIGKDIRLINVNIDRMSDVKKALAFYMGKNTPERKDYIMKNLV
ncbi:MAG: type IIA DNA topoisomerase subunit B [Spirochaetes bacterium]|nr:type IIA DNA topoisomerase subunit B [Spirochaetota bacterium]